MRSPSARTRRTSLFIAAPAALLAVGLLTWGWSGAAFTAQTRNTGNSWETGSLTLSDDDQGLAAFNITNVQPGDSGSHCITVTSTSTNVGIVKLYLARMGADGLENNITISTEIGHGGSFGSCEGFEPTGPAGTFDSIALSAEMSNSYATGDLAWQTTGNTAGESMSYRFNWRFDTSNLTQTQVDDLQGKSVSADVVWELQTPTP